MAFDYSSLASTASGLIAEFGQSMTLSVRGAATGTAFAPSETFTNVPVTACHFSFRSHEIDGSVIQAGDAKVLMSVEGLSTRPSTGDYLAIQGERWQILDVSPLSPAGTDVLYAIQARQ